MSSTALAPSAQTTTQRASSPLSVNLLASRSTPTKNGGDVTSTRTSSPMLAGQGGWLHPRMDEVIRRRNATNFDSSNMKSIMMSAGAILLSFFVPNLLHQTLPSSLLHTTQPYTFWTIWAVRLLFVLSIAISASPLLRHPDACEDVPLTAQQRQLLGLPPMSRPATPQEKEQYVTPPRFSRSTTPISSNSSLRAEAGGSPLSGRGSLTPVEGSWSHQRTSSGGLASGTEKRRLSYTGRSSPLSESLFDPSGSVLSVGTPTKGGNRTSMGLNNKWLYEKGRGSPRGSPKGSPSASRSSLFS